jgi:NAD(P)-dependent dehydrogenase (short-subunit alcohol dehydrogenase family)
MNEIDGNRYLVVGGSSGIGLELVRLLAEYGAFIHEWSRTPDPDLPRETDTPLAEAVLGSDKKRQTAAERHPLKRVGTAHDIAAGALYLLSPASGWVTGQILQVDGGLSALR